MKRFWLAFSLVALTLLVLGVGKGLYQAYEKPGNKTISEVIVSQSKSTFWEPGKPCRVIGPCGDEEREVPIHHTPTAWMTKDEATNWWKIARREHSDIKGGAHRIECLDKSP